MVLASRSANPAFEYLSVVAAHAHWRSSDVVRITQALHTRRHGGCEKAATGRTGEEDGGVLGSRRGVGWRGEDKFGMRP